LVCNNKHISKEFVRKYTEKFVSKSYIPDQSTRNCLTNDSQLQLHVKPITLNISSQNPLNMAARILKKLPNALKEIVDWIFAKKFKKILRQKMFYDLH
jgi:hypothetical protein